MRTFQEAVQIPWDGPPVGPPQPPKPDHPEVAYAKTTIHSHILAAQQKILAGNDVAAVMTRMEQMIKSELDNLAFYIIGPQAQV